MYSSCAVMSGYFTLRLVIVMPALTRAFNVKFTNFEKTQYL